jgi:protease-4
MPVPPGADARRLAQFITQEMWAKLGVTWDGVAFSENSKFFDGNHDYTEEGRRRGNVYVDRVYEDFVRQVAAGRSLSPEQVEEAAKGRVWTGVQAQQLRLVDVVGGLLSAVEEVKKLLALNEKQEIELVSVPKPKSIVDALLRGKPAENSREQDKAALQTNPLRGLAALASPSEAALRDLPGLVATLALVRGSDGAAALAAQGAIALRRATETGVQPLDSGLEGSLPLR